MTQRNELLKLLQTFEELSDGTLGTGNWKVYPVDFQLKQDVKPIFFANVSSTEGTQGNVLKLGLNFSSNRSP